jgi:hypothetical protein
MTYYNDQATEVITEAQERLSEIRSEWIARLAAAGLQPSTCTLSVADIYRNSTREDGRGCQVSYDNQYTVHGNLRESEVLIQGYYSGSLPYNTYDHTGDSIWHPESYYVDFVRIDDMTVQGGEAQKIAKRILPLVAPYTDYLEAEALREIRKHDKWIKGAPERERQERERVAQERRGENAKEQAVQMLSESICRELNVDNSQLWRDESWGSKSYYFKYERPDREKEDVLSRHRNALEYDKECWLTDLEKFGLRQEDSNLVFEYYAHWIDDSTRIRVFGAYQGKDQRECRFKIEGDINGLPVLVRGMGFVNKDSDVRGWYDCRTHYALEEVTVGDLTVPEPNRYGWAIARVIDSMTQPSTCFKERQIQYECDRREREHQNQDNANEARRRLNSLFD